MPFVTEPAGISMRPVACVPFPVVTQRETVRVPLPDSSHDTHLAFALLSARLPLRLPEAPETL
jgi:hypothetical protein